ncbi:rho GTPase-activating protein 19-like [Haliotis asinina]|uniref:rho GTPase-activating protein 19-like n=1 Tax=Haliotis asinina TaxID=109174 RepID=UPI00353269B6
MEDCGGCFDLRRRENIKFSHPDSPQTSQLNSIATHVSPLFVDYQSDEIHTLDQDIYETTLAMSLTMSTVRRRQTEAEKNLNRLRSVRPEKLSAMCKMHLSFLLDLDGAKLEELSSETTDNNKPDKKRGCSTPFSKKKGKGLFGSPVSEENVAQVYQLIEFLGRPENIAKEGLFRKNGNICRQRILKELLEQGHNNLCLDDGTFTAHDVAAVLKHYLAELPEQLLTEKHAEAHKQIFDMGRDVSESDRARIKDKQLKALQLLFHLLPRENALLLECVLDLLHKVAKVSENRMTSQALGTIFTPHLFCSRKLTPAELHTASMSSAKAVSFLVDNAQTLFKIPRELAVDVSNFWREMEDPNYNSNRPDSSEKNNNITRPKKWGSGPALNTLVCYIDRPVCQQADTASDTQVALAKLYAHVQAMPESAKKKKLLKQFNRASGNTQPKNKHTRSRTFGESLKKHFPVLHKHKRRGSNDPAQLTENLNWGLTKPILIEEVDDDKVTIIKCGNSPPTPNNNKEPKAKVASSPAVHIVDMRDHNTHKTNTRKRRSNEDMDRNVPFKKDNQENISTQKHPSAENEINYMNVNMNVRKTLYFTPERNKPIAMVSPITQSMCKASKSVQKQVLTPRSRKAMSLVQSPVDYESSM